MMHLYHKEESTVTDALYERYAESLFSYLRQHTPTREDAEDILLEVFTAALEDEKFAGLSESAQTSWLWRVTRNKVAGAFRRARVRQSFPLEHVTDLVDENHTGDPERVILHLDSVAHLQKLMKHLSPLQQEILQLRFGYDLTCAEIAVVLGKRETAIRTTLSRALNILRTRGAKE